MRKKILITLIIFFIVAFIIMGGMWLINRQAAIKNGREPLTFREFITGTTKSPTGSDIDGGLSSEFTPPNPTTQPGSNPNDPSNPSSISTSSSNFTNNVITPTDSGVTINDENDGIAPPDGDYTIGGNEPLNVGPGTSIGSGIVQGGSLDNCSDADLNITFSSEELSRLRALQERFNVIAPSLRSDKDVATELANYSSFKSRGARADELLAYCKTKTPLLGNESYKITVPTPFWRNPQKDSLGFVLFYKNINQGRDISVVDPTDKEHTYESLERLLRLNLW